MCGPSGREALLQRSPTIQLASTVGAALHRFWTTAGLRCGTCFVDNMRCANEGCFAIMFWRLVMPRMSCWTRPVRVVSSELRRNAERGGSKARNLGRKARALCALDLGPVILWARCTDRRIRSLALLYLMSMSMDGSSCTHNDTGTVGPRVAQTAVRPPRGGDTALWLGYRRSPFCHRYMNTSLPRGLRHRFWGHTASVKAHGKRSSPPRMAAGSWKQCAHVRAGDQGYCRTASDNCLPLLTHMLLRP